MINIITTADGSHSLFHSALNETYHSTHGAVQESRHVFIEHGLHFVWNSNPREIQIMEIGFGTGLNALLTLQEALTIGRKITYVAFEKFPISPDLATQLNYPAILDWPGAKHWFDQLHQAPWDEKVVVSPFFELEKRTADVTELLSLGEGKYDLVYFDAFAPSRQPEMWSSEVVSHVKYAMKVDGVLVTYCAQGQFKRTLKNLGMQVATLPGPPGKREMVRAFQK